MRIQEYVTIYRGISRLVYIFWLTDNTMKNLIQMYILARHKTYYMAIKLYHDSCGPREVIGPQENIGPHGVVRTTPLCFNYIYYTSLKYYSTYIFV